jgi:hypothetical protein
VSVGVITLLGTNLSYSVNVDKIMESAVGVWLFDEGTGKKAKDISGEGNHGELVKNPEWVAGKFGKALEFNGKDTCVQTEQKLLDNLEEFTILCWVKTGKITANRVGLVGQNDSPEFGFINPTSVNLWTPKSSLTNPWKHGHPSKDWHHIGAVAAKKNLRVYIDGEAAEGGGPGPHGTSDFNVNIGGCGVWDATGNWFTGAMDEVAIFHSALEDDEVKAIMEDGFKVMLAVAARGKLAVRWGEVKHEN